MNVLARFAVVAGLSLMFVAMLEPAHAQESEDVPYTPTATPRTAPVTGLRVQFRPDAGCLCHAESRIPNDFVPCNGALCSGARLRAANDVAVAIDGGALER